MKLKATLSGGKNKPCRDLPGKKVTKVIETEHIQAYAKKFGERPPGNPVD